jgi:hypothetical protein
MGETVIDGEAHGASGCKFGGKGTSTRAQDRFDARDGRRIVAGKAQRLARQTQGLAQPRKVDHAH